MIGKNFRDVFGKQKGQKGQQNKRRTKKSDNSDNFRQLFSTLKSMETASRTRNALGERMFETTWTTRDNFFKVRRPTGRRLGARAARPLSLPRPARKAPPFSCVVRRSKRNGARVNAQRGRLKGVVGVFGMGREGADWRRKSRLARRPTAVLPPSRPLPLVFCHASAFHAWPRHPPLGGGARPVALLAPCMRGIPEGGPL